MDKNQKIAHLAELGRQLRASAEFNDKIENAERKNPWFAPSFVRYATEAIIHEMLNEAKLEEWLSRYQLQVPSLEEMAPVEAKKTVGLIFAGNIPLVGFHDFLCGYVTDVNMKIKLSSRDDELFPPLLKAFTGIDKSLSKKVEIVDKLKNFDAVIATGSDNTNRYFDYYFRDYPKILRRNRNSVAILTGNETKEDLERLADDIFLYFGFGCRNVSKLYVPVGYDVTVLFPAFEKKYSWLHQHTRYMNNYDYNRTMLMLNKTPHLANEFLMLTENPSIPSPIATLHYEYWQNENELRQKLRLEEDKIQCVVSREPGRWHLHSPVIFGQSQHPELWDYADGVDTIKFLLGFPADN